MYDAKAVFNCLVNENGNLGEIGMKNVQYAFAELFLSLILTQCLLPGQNPVQCKSLEPYC